MRVKELKDLLARHEHQEDLDVQVLVALPSMGPRATSLVEYASFGFDWDKGLLLKTKDRLVPKHEKQDVYEQAHDLLMWLATSPAKRETYPVWTAKRILKRNGYTDEDFDKYRYLFHENKTHHKS